MPEAYESTELKFLQFHMRSPCEVGISKHADMKADYRKELGDTKLELSTINQNCQKIHSSQ
jgi:hypothetical protein